MTRRWIFRILLVLYLCAVAWLCFGHFSNIPNIKMSYWGIPTDKIVHFLMFFPFPLLAFGGFDKYTTKPWHSFLFVAVLFGIGCLLAGATEITTVVIIRMTLIDVIFTCGSYNSR